MNWKEIKEKSKIWKLIEEFILGYYGIHPSRLVIDDFDGVNKLCYQTTDGVHSIILHIPLIDDRLLYDFFDEQEIIVCIEFNVSLQLLECWIVTKHEDGRWSGGMVGGWKPDERAKAEEAGWNKAFEILEQQKNGNN